MFPWYSGTSADLYRTIFGLVVSLKLFLGRFDMRTMQVSAFHAFGHPQQAQAFAQRMIGILSCICCHQYDSADLTLSGPS